MKHTRKILVALILVFTMVVGITAITASAAEAEETRTVYLNPGAEYSKDNAWFAIWSWVEGQDGAWYVATDKESDGIYEIELPVANDGLKVLRMDPAVNTPDWSTGKWNESGNITIPEDKDLLTLSGWTPDAEWSTYTYVAPTFTVAGDGALCGDTTPDDTTSGWESSNTANDMTLGEDGIYTKSFTGIAAGTYEFKVLRNHSWDKAWPAANYKLTVEADNSTVTVSFNPATAEVIATAVVPQPEAPAPVKPIVNISDLTIETTTDAELVEGTGISASAGLTVDENGKKIDGFEFTKRLKLGGTMKLDGEVVKAGIKIVVDGPSKVIVYGMASSSSATGRTLHLATVADGKLVSVEGSDSGEVGGAAIAKYEFAISEAGTYYLGSTDSGINLYYIAVEEAKAPAHVNTLAVGDTNKIVIGDTAVDNGYGYLVESVLFTVTEKAHYEFVGEGLTILVYDSSMNNLCGFTGKADLEAGTYIICIAANTQNTKGEFNVKVTKTEISEGGEEEEKLPALALGDNTVTIDGSQVNITGNAVAWYTFTPTEDGTYKFSCSDLTVYILSSKNMADGTAYIGADGVAELKADTKYYVLVGKDGVTGEFTVKVESGAAPVHVNTIVVGDNKYIISDALLKTEYEFLLIEITEAGIYKFTGGAPMTLFVFHDAYVGEALDATAPYTDNVDDITYEYVDHFYVKLAAPGYYWVGFRYDYVGELREFDINVALHSEHTFAEGKCTECGAADPNYVPPHEHKFVEGKCECGETDPNYVAPEQPKPEDPKPEELGFFQMILKAITDFFAKVGNFFSGIFGKIGGFFSGLFGGNK